MLRGSRGEAAGEELGADPVDRFVVNVGTRSGLPSAPACRAGAGQGRGHLMARAGGGAAVVVRGRESRSQGPQAPCLRSRAAKGGSVSAASGLESQEVAGEYQRSAAGPYDGMAAGTEDPDEAASMGRV